MYSVGCNLESAAQQQSHVQETLFKLVLVKFQSLPRLILTLTPRGELNNLPLREVIINCPQYGFIMLLAVEESCRYPN